MSASAKLVLADGTIYAGTTYAAQGTVYGQLIFDTTMTGYQQTLTNPSNTGTITVFTFPHIGNVGVNDADAESDNYWPAGVVVREPSRVHSNWQSERDLESDLTQADVVGIAGIDTRALTRHLAGKGQVTAGIFAGEAAQQTDEELIKQVQDWQPAVTADMLAKVSTEKTYEIPASSTKNTVGVLDLGLRRSTLNQLVERGNTVKVFPANTTTQELLDANVDGVVLSSGPGNPATAEAQIALVTGLLEAKKPLLGIGLGHQIIGHALGYETVLLPKAQRGPNQPVYDVASGQSLITTQNHQYAVQAPQGTHPAPNSAFGAVTVTQYSLNDNSVEALKAETLPVLSVQYYPEDTAIDVTEPHPVFDAFATLMANGKVD